MLTYAHARAMADVKHARLLGKLWRFPCTAGERILVITDSGTLRACEHRGAVADLRAYDFDVGRALATGAMAREREDIARERCDCIHGCFVGNSLQHSVRGIVRHELPQVPRFLATRVTRHNR
jgi:hypothetical protein